MKAVIKAIEYILPTGKVTNEQLAAEFAGFTPEKIESKTGIVERHIAVEGECASDLGVRAANKLFGTGVCQASTVDFLLFCTQSPDYFLPTTACLVQERLGLPTSVGALDFNLGCSGFVYGLSLAKGLIETGQAKNVLLLTAETYSKHINSGDRNLRTLFGDAAAATLVGATTGGDQESIGPFVFGTDGRGANNLIVPTGGMRSPQVPNAEILKDKGGSARSVNNLFMDGREIFNFTLEAVPVAFNELLSRARKTSEEIDLFVFHQANAFMLEHLRQKLSIPTEKFLVSMAACGNTVSSTIPIALKDASIKGSLHSGSLVMLVGFGVGYSWSATLIRWP
jgi:3-oxoacyl-[acyl-carrier-protein] synthase-3